MNASCRSTSGCVFINLYRISTYLSLGKAMTESCNIVPILSIYRSRRRLYCHHILASMRYNRILRSGASK